MKKKLYTIVAIFCCYQSMAQLPEDALRMSWNTPSGTARQQAIGGAMGSLGGEISSIFVNPAGLGLYKTGEVVLSPGFSFLKNKGQFLGTGTSADRLSKFNLGTSGLVWGHANRYGKWRSAAFGIAVNRTANFNNSSLYRGTNDYSSFTEPQANEFFDYYSERKAADPSLSNQRIIDDAFEADISLQTKMSLYTYLIDVDTANGTNTVISRAEQVGIVDQQNKTKTSGGITEIAFGFAGNMEDKFYIGGSLGVPIVNYERNSVYSETDATGSNNNEFDFASYEENYSVKGLGLNAKLGIIFKPANLVRIGFGIHTPTLYGLKDKLSAKMVTDVEQVGIDSVNSALFYENQDPEFRYDLISPWKFILSGSYVFHEVDDVTKQKGFITADVEYVTHKSSKYSSAEENGDDSYYKGVNNAIKEEYKNAFNFRIGGELKFKTIMTRLGFAYFGRPYQESDLKASRMNVSGGLGYRNKGIFVDLAYVHSINKDVNFPYRLDAPRQNVFAELKDSNGNLIVTVGFKF